MSIPPTPPLPSSAGQGTDDAQPRPPEWPSPRRYCKYFCEENAYLLAEQLLSDVEVRCKHRGPKKSAVDAQGWKWDVWVIVVSNANKTVLLYEQRASTRAGRSPAETQVSGCPVVWDYHVFPIVTAKRVRSARFAEEQEEQEVQVPAPPVAQSQTVDGSYSTPRKARPLFARRATTSDAKDVAESGKGTTAVTASSTETTPVAPWQAWVYDVDSLLCSPSSSASPTPVPFETYVSRTFGPHPGHLPAPSELQPTFRLSNATAFLDNFASDRSHMLHEGPQGYKEYSCQTPSWPPIVGHRAKRKGWDNNLMEQWVNMKSGTAASGAIPASGSASAGDLTHAELKVQFGTVIERDQFSRGHWRVTEWKRRPVPQPGPVAKDQQRRGKMTLEESKGVNRNGAKVISNEEDEASRILSSASPTSPSTPHRGGRVTSPLFPAYMHGVLQARAERQRESYLALDPGRWKQHGLDSQGNGGGGGGNDGRDDANQRDADLTASDAV
ncbi:unnamed protein product [Jaminaea pallidilutea]